MVRQQSLRPAVFQVLVGSAVLIISLVASNYVISRTPVELAAENPSVEFQPNKRIVIATFRNRFEVKVDWRNFQGVTGVGTIAEVPSGSHFDRPLPVASNDSGMFWFFSENNWELLLKVLDGCSINGHHWVFTAASTNVEYHIEVTDTWTGTQRNYSNPLGVAAPATTDTQAFDNSCSMIYPPPVLPGGECEPDEETFCFGTEGRFRVRVWWRNFQGVTGYGKVAEVISDYPAPTTPLLSEDTGLFWFFSENNWELVLKVLDGCGLNNRFWVFSAATTNVEYLASVKDLHTGQVRNYFNPLGVAASAVTDTDAFDTCGAKASLMFEGAPDAIEIETIMNTASRPTGFALPSVDREEALPWLWVSCSGFSNGIVALNGEELTYIPNLGWIGEDAGVCVVSNGAGELTVPVLVTVINP